MKSYMYSGLSIALAVGVLSGCTGSDTGPVIPAKGPVASAEDQRTPQSDALTSQESGLVSQVNSEPNPTPKPDL
jgi:hypothetical protein